VRRASGVSTIELVIGLIIAVPVILLLVDLALVVFAVQVNDSTAREAARVAASGDPQFAQQRASMIIDKANAGSSGIISNFKLVSVTFSPTDLLADEARLVPLGGTINGTVSIKTQVDVKPFAVEFAYSAKSPLQFVSQQTFPFTYNVPNTATKIGR
jgi:hypothetical protein